MTLVPRFVYGDLDLTDHPFLLEFGSDFGAPENVAAVVESLLADGEIIDVERVNNREIALPILVDDADMVALAEAEALLAREAAKVRNTLTVDPGDGFGAVTVFDTWRASLTFARDDDLERTGYRRFILTIPALPFARSESLTSTEATAVPSVGTVIDDCEDTASFTWTATPFTSSGNALTPATPLAVNASRFVEGAGSMAVQPNYGYSVGYGPGINGGSHYRYGWDVDLDETTADDSYFSFAFYASNYNADGDARWGLISFAITTDEYGTVTYDPTGGSDVIVQTIEDGFLSYTVRLVDGVHLTGVSFVAWQDDPAPVGSEPYPAVLIDRIALAESATLGAQVLKTVEVGGSARTPGSIHVAAPTDAVGLGQVVVFSVDSTKVAAGFRPDLRQWDDGTGATTADADATNGSYYSVLGTNENYTETSPALLAPAALFNSTAHTMVARLWSPAAAGTDLYLGVQAQLVVDGVEVGDPISVRRDWDDTGASGYEMIPLGSLYLPPLPIASATSEALVRFRFIGNVYVDELYAFPVDGDLSIIDCGAGTSGPAVSSHLWIDSPSASQPQGGYWRGETGDRINSVSAWAVANVPGTHVFEPGTALLFAAATGTEGPTVNLDYYKAWLFNAPE